METKRINDAGCEQEEVLGVQVLRGWVYRIVAESKDAWDCSKECELEDGSVHVEQARFGYHGNDAAPCGADYLSDEDDGSYLVISSESDPAEIDTVDGFSLEPVKLDSDWSYADGAWTVKAIHVQPSGETILCGRT